MDLSSVAGLKARRLHAGDEMEEPKPWGLPLGSLKAPRETCVSQGDCFWSRFSSSACSVALRRGLRGQHRVTGHGAVPHPTQNKATFGEWPEGLKLCATRR